MKKPVVFLIIFTIVMGFIFFNANSEDKEFQPADSNENSPTQYDSERYDSNIIVKSPRNQLSKSDSEDYGSYIKIESSIYDLSLSNQIARTGSMNPAIPDGSKIITRKPSSLNDFILGDIVCFWSKTQSGTQICHRIIEIDGDRIFTRGDNVNGGGEMRTRDEINSIVVGVLY